MFFYKANVIALLIQLKNKNSQIWKKILENGYPKNFVDEETYKSNNKNKECTNEKLKS